MCSSSQNSLLYKPLSQPRLVAHSHLLLFHVVYHVFKGNPSPVVCSPCSRQCQPCRGEASRSALAVPLITRLTLTHRIANSVFNSLTSDIASVASVATSGGVCNRDVAAPSGLLITFTSAGSVFSDATSFGGSVYTDATSFGGSIATIVTCEYSASTMNTSTYVNHKRPVVMRTPL